MSVCRGSFSIFIPLVLLFLIGSAGIVQTQTTADRTLRLQVDAPGRTATVDTPIPHRWMGARPRVGLGPQHRRDSRMGLPGEGGADLPWRGDAQRKRADVADVFGAQFQNAGFSLLATGTHRPGAYTLQVFARRTSTGTFDVVEQMPVTVRGITLSDLDPCETGQSPQFNGTAWVCAANPAGLRTAGARRPDGCDGRSQSRLARQDRGDLPAVRGPQGAKGTQGAPGLQGAIGPQGSDRTAGTRRPDSITGDVPGYVEQPDDVCDRRRGLLQRLELHQPVERQHR